MTSEAFNLKFVAAVEKLPELYNYKLKGYSKKDVTDKAWNEVAKEVQLSVTECKQKWKNLRSVFVRHLRPSASGSSTNIKKPYYLSEAMKFALPFIKTMAEPERNSSEIAIELQSTSAMSLKLSDDCLDNTYTEEEEEEEEEDQQQQQQEEETVRTTTLWSPIPSDVLTLTHVVEEDDSPLTSKSASRKRKQNTICDMDKLIKDFTDEKKKKISCEINKDPQRKKTFLLSLLPEIEPLTDAQMRSFRREVLRLIDDIRDTQEPIQRIQSPSQNSSHGDVVCQENHASG